MLFFFCFYGPMFPQKNVRLRIRKIHSRAWGDDSAGRALAAKS